MNNMDTKRKLYNFNNVRNYVTLVKLMDTVGNLSHDVTVSDVYIFDKNYRKILPLIS